MKFPCRKSKVQEYDCQVCVKSKWKSSHKWICFDKCLADELFYLWDLGIITTGCCCGHKEHTPYIGVEKEYIPQMKKLGYKVAHNPMRPIDEDSFLPLTKKI